ncbi:hypothetical protein SEVIR_1G105301v4 [Setaria viridis]
MRARGSLADAGGLGDGAMGVDEDADALGVGAGEQVGALREHLHGDVGPLLHDPRHRRRRRHAHHLRPRRLLVVVRSRRSRLERRRRRPVHCSTYVFLQGLVIRFY